MSLIKNAKDCDYIVYLNKNKEPIGFELAHEEIELVVKANNLESVDYTLLLPKGTSCVMECYKVASILIWRKSDDKEIPSRFLYYKPNYYDLAETINDSLGQAVEIGAATIKPGDDAYVGLCLYHHEGKCILDDKYTPCKGRGCRDYELSSETMESLERNYPMLI